MDGVELDDVKLRYIEIICKKENLGKLDHIKFWLMHFHIQVLIIIVKATGL